MEQAIVDLLATEGEVKQEHLARRLNADAGEINRVLVQLRRMGGVVYCEGCGPS